MKYMDNVALVAAAGFTACGTAACTPMQKQAESVPEAELVPATGTGNQSFAAKHRSDVHFSYAKTDQSHCNMQLARDPYVMAEAAKACASKNAAFGPTDRILETQWFWNYGTKTGFCMIGTSCTVGSGALS